jgi:hypothetical protein
MTAIDAAALPAVEPAGLRTYANPNDVRRDLHAFVAYVEGRTIKRTHTGQRPARGRLEAPGTADSRSWPRG